MGHTEPHCPLCATGVAFSGVLGTTKREPAEDCAGSSSLAVRLLSSGQAGSEKCSRSSGTSWAPALPWEGGRGGAYLFPLLGMGG